VEHARHRHLDVAVDAVEPGIGCDLRMQATVELQRHVGVFRCILGRALDRHLLEGNPACALSRHFVVGKRLEVEVAFGEIVHVVRLVAFQHVRLQQRVVRDAAKRDPLEFLLDLLGPGKVIDLKAQGVDYSNYGAPIDKYPVDTRRLRRVLEVAADRSGWAKRKSGNGAGMGIAAHRSFNTYVASVVQVEVDRQGRVKIPRITQVADPGVVINPDRVRSQFEGAAVMGVGLAMFGEITATNGRIDQKNFDGFRVARMNDAPVQVDVHFVESGNLPTGVGEPGVPPVIAALGNAIYAATGKRLREMPFSKTKLV